jgi:hypothetical protein
MADRLCIYPEFYRRNPPFTLFLSFSLFFSERQKERERERERERRGEREESSRTISAVRGFDGAARESSIAH